MRIRIELEGEVPPGGVSEILGAIARARPVLAAVDSGPSATRGELAGDGSGARLEAFNGSVPRDAAPAGTARKRKPAARAEASPEAPEAQDAPDEQAPPARPARQVSQADVVAIARRLGGSHPAAVLGVLKGLGVARVDALQAHQFLAFVESCEAFEAELAPASGGGA